jgi:hypothetical protein
MVFWVMAPCSLVGDCQCFRGICCFLVKIGENYFFSKMVATVYHITQRKHPKNVRTVEVGWVARRR